MTGLHGVNPILPTPFTAQGELDVPSLERLLDLQLGAVVDGVAILGFLGEAHKLSEAERRQVVETTVGRIGGSIPVWVGVRALGTAGAVEQARAAESLGASAVFVAPIAPQSDEALYQHYRTVAQAIDLPLILHDYPASFGITLSPELIARLSIDGFAPYVKLEDPPVLQKLTRIRELTGGGIGVFGGLGGEYFLEELQRGARGIMTGFAFPEVLVRIHRAFTSGDIAEATRTFDHFMPLIRYEFQPKIGLALRKHVFHLRGAFATEVIRLPGMALDEVTQKEFEAIVARLGLPLEPGRLELD